MAFTVMAECGDRELFGAISGRRLLDDDHGVSVLVIALKAFVEEAIEMLVFPRGAAHPGHVDEDL